MKKRKKDILWTNLDDRLYLGGPAVQTENLDNAVYELNYDENRNVFYLIKLFDKFDFDYKIYDLETSFVERVIKTYESTSFGNLGILLNGLKGTGKTVSSKIISNRLNQPTIIVDNEFPNLNPQSFLNSIPQNITIFIDEYEKVYGDSSKMLTIMDGVLNSSYRRAFILTTNNLYIEENLLQRPSRIRYLKKFKDLSANVVEEIVDDCLKFPQFKKDCLAFISSLEVITVDIVKAIVAEVNIHEESPNEFGDVFNVNKLRGKYNIYIEDNAFEPIEKKVSIYPKPEYDDHMVGNYFQIDHEYAGIIEKVIDFDSIVLAPFKKGDNIKSPAWLKKSTTIKVETAEVFHYNYRYGANKGKTVGFVNNNESFMELD